jgi:phage baseplate assembly protein W
MSSQRHPFEIDAGVGRVRIEPDRSAYIRQLMLQVLLTSPGERIDRPDFGCGVRRMVFAPNNPATATLTQVLVLEAMNTWLDELIEVLQIDVTAQDATLAIAISYRDRETGRTDVLNEVVR